MACRTGCTTRDHESYGACLRAAGTKVAYCNSAGGWDASRQKAWDKELDLYRSARDQGIEPASTRTKDIEAAFKASEKTGVAFQGA